MKLEAAECCEVRTSMEWKRQGPVRRPRVRKQWFGCSSVSKSISLELHRTRELRSLGTKVGVLDVPTGCGQIAYINNLREGRFSLTHSLRKLSTWSLGFMHKV